MQRADHQLVTWNNQVLDVNHGHTGDEISRLDDLAVFFVHRASTRAPPVPEKKVSLEKGLRDTRSACEKHTTVHWLVGRPFYLQEHCEICVRDFLTVVVMV